VRRKQETLNVKTNSQMQAAVLVGPNHVQLSAVDIPVPKEGEVRVRVEGCGVCGSNLAPWEGRAWFKYPFAPGEPGHEGWGQVDAVGPGVKHLQKGDRVAMLTYRAFAEYDIASAQAVVGLPERLADKPFPGEALGCALNVFRRCQIERKQNVAIVGIGFLGATLTSLSAQAGARVFAISRRPFAREVAKKLGAAESLNLGDQASVLEAIKTATDGRGCHCVIEAVGRQETLDLATELTCERGRLVIAGYHQDGPRQINLQLWNWRGLDVINAHERDPEVYLTGIKAAVEAVTNGTLDPFPLFTHTFPLKQIDLALNAMRERPANFLKALVTV
jgi:threonine dehydrogenase-like Zn-dependent dehydrogenase